MPMPRRTHPPARQRPPHIPGPCAIPETTPPPGYSAASSYLLCPPQGRFDLAARCLLRLLGKHMHHDDAPATRGNVGRARNPVSAFHAHLPNRPFQVLHIRLAHSLQAVTFDETDDPLKTSSYIARHRGKRRLHRHIEELNRPPSLHCIPFLRYPSIRPTSSPHQR